MVRGIIKKIEGAIAITIFVLFIIFYLNTYRILIYQDINKEIYNNFQTIENIYYQLTKEGYIVSFRVNIPKYSKELLCTINDPEIRKDFCEKHPIFIPINLSFILENNGILNNTNNTLLKTDLGAFLYLNLSDLQCDNEEYILVEIEGPITSSKAIFITTPTLYYWLKNKEFILVSTKNETNFEYCYLSANGICSNSNYDIRYGIILKIDYAPPGKIIFNISRSKNDSSSTFNISNLNYMNYKILFEPTCYLNLNFLILKDILFDFNEYKDLNCFFYNMINSKIYYNYLYKTLKDIYTYITIYNESKLFDPLIINFGPACVQYYKNYDQKILNVYRILFSNTAWFFEIAEYNISDIEIGSYLRIWDYLFNTSEFSFSNYFNFTNFIRFNNQYIISNKILLKKEREMSNCKYTLIFFDSNYNISTSFERRFNVYRIIPIRNIDSTFLRLYIFYYCVNRDDLILPVELYYSYSLPKVEFLYINKIYYVDLKDLINKENITFYLVNRNLFIGNIENKKYSRSYYIYLKENNSLIEDYLIIYI